MIRLWDLGHANGPRDDHAPTATTLPEAFAHAVAARGDAAFLRTKRLGIWTGLGWREAATAVAEAATGMAALGVRPGDVVCTVADTRAECAIADLAAMHLGAVSAAVVPGLVDDTAALVRSLAPALVVVDDLDRWSASAYGDEAARAGVPVVVLGAGLDGSASASASIAGSVTGWPALLALGRAAGVHAPAHPVSADAIAIVSFTAGSTGAPLPVRHTHRAVLDQCRALNGVVPHRATDMRLSFLPWARINERIWGLYLPIVSGMSIGFCEGQDTVPHNLREFAPSVVSATPRQLARLQGDVLAMLADAGGVSRAAWSWALRAGEAVAARVLAREAVGAGLRLLCTLGRVAVINGVRRFMGLDRCRHLIVVDGTLPPPLARWYLALGVPIVQTWGTSEALGVSSVDVLPDLSPGSAGRPLPTHRVTVDGAGSAGGELRIAVSHAEAGADGELPSGDVGHLAEDGRVRVAGRARDYWRLGSGEAFAAAALRSGLAGSPYVEDAIVVGEGRPFASVLILMAREPVERHAHRAGVSFSDFADLAHRPEVRALFQAEIDRVNAALPAPHRVQSFLLIDEELMPGDPEMTPTMGLRGWAVEARRRSAIQSLYS